MKKIISCILVCLVICCSIASIAVYAADNLTITDNDVMAELVSIKWLNNNYKDVYTIRNIQANTVRTFETNVSTKYYVTLTCETLLKFDDVEDLPFIQGMREEMAETLEMSSVASTTIGAYIDDVESYIGQYTPYCVNLVVEVPKDNANSVVLYYQDGQTTTLYSIDMLDVDIVAMKQDGRETARGLIEAVASIQGYATYDRIAARDYALTYTSNAAYCVDCGETSEEDEICSNKLDSSKWNNTDYWVYGDPLLHGNCADYVSQAMHAGGIPVDAGLWDRYNDADNGWSWTEPNAQRSYMLGKGYWEASTFAAANAGNIICWVNGTSVYHVGMITLNDTVTHRYSAHTYDVQNCVFGSGMSCEYYVIETD